MAAVGLRGVGLGDPIATSGDRAPGKVGASSWDSIVKGMEHQIGKISSGGVALPSGLTGVAGITGVKGAQGVSASGGAQLGELLKLQVEMHRVQVRVELLSKVTESATATFRKLEQGQ